MVAALAVLATAGLVALAPAAGPGPIVGVMQLQEGGDPPGLAWPRGTGRLAVSARVVWFRPICFPDEPCEF